MPGKRELKFSVCDTLQTEEHIEDCTVGQGACLHQHPDHTGDTNLGWPVNPELDDDDRLVMIYHSFTTPNCPGGITTTIRFYCSQSTGDLGAPQFTSESQDSCEFDAAWTTSAACPIRKNTGDVSTCIVSDDVLGSQYDFSGKVAIMRVSLKYGSTEAPFRQEGQVHLLHQPLPCQKGH